MASNKKRAKTSPQEEEEDVGEFTDNEMHIDDEEGEAAVVDEEEDVQEEEETEEDCKPLSKPRRKPAEQKAKVAFDPETDIVCNDVRAFFDAYPNGPVSQKSTILRVDENKEVAIGKTMYTMRTKSRQDKQTGLLRDRIETLSSEIPAFAAFLQQPSLSKPKPGPGQIHEHDNLKEMLIKLDRLSHDLDFHYFTEMAAIAKTELKIFELQQQLKEDNLRFNAGGKRRRKQREEVENDISNDETEN